MGVNCNAGADWDGSVVCNDGYRDSSTSYYSADECTDNIYNELTLRCPLPSNNCYNPYPSCTEDELESIKAQLGVSRGLGYSSAGQQLIDNCQEKIDRSVLRCY